MTRRLLRLLKTPRTLSELARALGLEEETVRLLLRKMEAAGYVGRAFEGSEACDAACAACSLKRLCPAAGRPQAQAPAVYRLTAKGWKALS